MAFPQHNSLKITKYFRMFLHCHHSIPAFFQPIFGSTELIPCQVGDEGKVIGIDHIEELVNDSVKNVRKKDGDLLDKKTVELVGKVISFQTSFC